MRTARGDRPTAGARRGRTVVTLAALLAVMAVVVAACGSDSATEEAGGASGTSGASAGTEATAAPPAANPTASHGPKVGSPEDPMNQDPVAPGATRMHFEVGPIAIKPGQNNIDFTDGRVPHPDVDGWILRISPNIRKADGTVPPVDVIHLHHGVWLNSSRADATAPLPERIFAAGEEKSIAVVPDGFGYRNDPDDTWTINYMIHNLFDFEEEIWITYDLDFLPADAPEAAGIREVRPVWMDVENGELYPVFDVFQGTGTNGRFTYPDDAADPYAGGPPQNEWVVDRDSVIIGTAGHLHPGGTSTDLYVRRDGTAPTGAAAEGAKGDAAHLFSSEFVYWEPAGAVSWDVAAKRTPMDWRVAVKAGDVLSMTATYDTTRASWYESMGIMVLWLADGTDGADPFTEAVAVDGEITHEHLPENDHHGGEDAGLPDATVLPDGELVDAIDIDDFRYGLGDTSELETDIPLVKAGGSITFDNLEHDEDNGIWHTITACKAPCNRSTGIAYPLADAGELQFDSGQLGFGGPPTAERSTWQTPDDLPSGTYTYFCRVHPFMRGAFRVVE